MDKFESVIVKIDTTTSLLQNIASGLTIRRVVKALQAEGMDIRLDVKQPTHLLTCTIQAVKSTNMHCVD